MNCVHVLIFLSQIYWTQTRLRGKNDLIYSICIYSFVETKVYVGNLGTGAGKGELERAFGYYGPLRTVWIARNPPGFAFVEFDDPRDAEDAVRGLDGK